MTDRTIKIILWITALGAAWDLGRSINSIFLFAVGGILPGTNTALTPNQSLTLSGILLFVSFLLIFNTNIRRIFKGVFGYKAVEGEIESTAEIAIPAESKITRKKATKPAIVYQSPKQPSLLITATRHLIGRVASVVLWVYHIVEKRFPSFAALCARTLQRAQIQARILCKKGIQYAKQLQRAAHIFIVTASIFAEMQARRFWQWLEPYLRRADDWLGVQYKAGLKTARKNETVKAITRLSHETDKVIMGWRDNAKEALSRVIEK